MKSTTVLLMFAISLLLALIGLRMPVKLNPARASADVLYAANSQNCEPASVCESALRVGDDPGDRIVVKLKDKAATHVTLGSMGHDSLDETMALLNIQAVEPLFDITQGYTELKRKLGLDRIYVLTLPPSADPQAALLGFSADAAAVEYAEPDFAGSGALMPNDGNFSQQWSLHNTGQSGGLAGADIDAPAAWNVTVGVSSTILAIIDSGVDLDHPDLVGKILPGYDYVNDDAVPQDDSGHGTHVAGIAAANTNNVTGIAGVCWECRIMPIKALDSEDSGVYTWWASSIEHAVDHGAAVINMSMGGSSDAEFFHDAVRYAYAAEIPIAAAMLNKGNETQYYPAAYTETIGVGSTDRHDARSSFSNYGDHLDLVAPGSSILSTIWNDTYTTLNGTSMATPHVVGVLGLMHAVNPGRTVEELRGILRTTAEDQVGPPGEDTPGWDRYFSAGRLNAARAVGYGFFRPLSGVVISGPATGLKDTIQPFTATVSPITATQPISYVWLAPGQPPAAHWAGLTDTVTFTWSTTGTHVLTVTATNIQNSVAGRYALPIFDAAGSISKTVAPVGQVSFGDELTYTLVISGETGARIGLYDPLEDTNFVRYVARPPGIRYGDGAITGTLMITPGNQVTVSIVAQIGLPTTAGSPLTVNNRGCVYPNNATIDACVWSDTVTNHAIWLHNVYLPAVMRQVP